MESLKVSFAAAAKEGHSLRGRATTIKPEILKDIAMADKQTVKSDETSTQDFPASSERPNSAGVDSKFKIDAQVEGSPERFPDFTTKQDSARKFKSLSTSATIDMNIFADENRAEAINRLKTISPPLDLQQARERRETIRDSARKIRSASISLIRSRTASRVEAQGQPNQEDIKSSE